MANRSMRLGAVASNRGQDGAWMLIQNTPSTDVRLTPGRTCQRCWRGDGRLAVVLLILLLASGCRAWRHREDPLARLSAARQLTLQGLEAQRRGHWSQAESLFAAAILQCPGDERARCGYAEALWQRGAHAAALTHMEEAVRLSGHDPQRLVQLGRMYLALGDVPRAADAATRAIQANSQCAAAWALRGEVLLAQGQTDEALAALHRALAWQQPLPEVKLAVARIYLEQGRPQRAYSTLEALAASYPLDQVPVEVLVPMALALRQMGRPGEAAERLAQAVRRADPSADLWYELAQTQLAAGNGLEARQALQAALKCDPHHAPSLALQEALGDAAASMAAAWQPAGIR